jgi:peptidoglycan hydrolase-like protein with peptidoglycan-binding domain
MSRVKKRRTGRVVAASAAVLAVGGATAAATTGLLDRGPSAAAAHSDLPPATAKVTRETLVDTQSESGQSGYGDTTTVKNKLPGTFTALPATGTVLRRGNAVYRIDNTPVTLLYGTLPAYRALKTGVEGPDVLQFERNLWALGYRGFTVDDTYSDATATAVREWQDDLGLTETGAVEAARIVYAAGPVRVDSRQVAVGDSAAPGMAALDLTGTAQVVTADLDVADQRLARRGAAVTVTLPDSSTVAGRIARTEAVVQPAEGQDPAQTKIEVTITLADQKALAGLTQATVQIAFTADTRSEVLTVPVAALLALAEGGYGVQVVDGSTTRIVAVETGLFASGRVEVSGGGLRAGTTVGMPS